MVGESELRDAIVEAYRRLDGLGFMVGSAGNLSMRTADGMLITPTGAAADTLAAEQLVAMSLDGRRTEQLRPSSEWRLHAAVYRRVPEAGAIIHCHADACVALASLRVPLPAFHYLVGMFGGSDVPCVGYHPFGSAALGEATAEALTTRGACLLANHGMVVRGATLAACMDAAILLESLARQYLMAGRLGEPVLLGEEEMAEVHRRLADYGRRPEKT